MEKKRSFGGRAGMCALALPIMAISLGSGVPAMLSAGGVHPDVVGCAYVGHTCNFYYYCNNNGNNTNMPGCSCDANNICQNASGN